MSTTTKPKVLPVQPENIPAELRDRDRWVLWRLECPKDKWTKEPYQANGRHASTTDSATWNTFDTVVEAYRSGQFDGIGLVLDGSDGLVGVDMDHVRDRDTGRIAAWPTAVRSTFKGKVDDPVGIVASLRSYTEASPSGTGLRVFCFGQLPPEGRKRSDFEVYSTERYFTVTGHKLPGSPATLRECNGELLDLHVGVFGKPDPKASTSTSASTGAPDDDDAVLAKAQTGKGGRKFTLLWEGDTSAHASESEADLALAGLLAFWCGPDADRIERLMRQSGLAREKWDKHKDYLSRTITKALQGRTEFYQWNPLRKVRIVLTTDEQRVTDQAVEALGGIRGVYQRAGQLVHVVRDTAPPRGCKRPKDSPRVAGLALPTLRERLAGAVEWLRPAGDDLEAAHPPEWCVKQIAARGQWPSVPPLEGVTEVPVLRSDGTVLDAPGYDPHSGLILAPSGTIEPVPEKPTATDLKAAIDLLGDVVVDFPFAGDDHRAAWFAGMLTPLCRHAFYGCAPLFLIDANCPGSGKGMLADVAAIISTGRTFARMSMPRDDDETRKRITSIALAGEPCVLLDNVAGTLGGASLDAALTATTWSDRLLGKSETTGAVPLLVTWFATSNNAALAGDILRRLLHVRLETREERPEERVGFRHTDLLAYVVANRQKLTAAALTILRAYCAAGRPDQGLKPLGSFEAWSDLVRHAVVYAGMADPALTRVALAETADTTGAALRALLEHLAAADPSGRGFTAAELVTLAQEEGELHAPLRAALLELVPTRGDKMPTTRSVGMKLHHLRGRVVGGLYLQDAKDGRSNRLWIVKSVN